VRSMANPEHLAKLKKSIKKWNEREANPEIVPDFTGADLSRRTSALGPNVALRARVPAAIGVAPPVSASNGSEA
jgi:hypothetical protein